MIAKKNKKANLERKRFAFFQIGLLVSGSLCLAAFEYSAAVPLEEQHITQDFGNGLDTEIPVDVIEHMPQQKQQNTVVNLDDVEDVKVVDKLKTEGDPIVTKGEDVISIDGDLGVDLLSGDDLKLAGDEGEIFDVVSKEPEFPGGVDAMFEWIRSHVVYPELARDMGIQGIVYVQFVVNKDGSITQVQSKQAPHADLAKESERVVSMMPKWNPGEQAGKKVRVRYTLPIQFKQY